MALSVAVSVGDAVADGPGTEHAGVRQRPHVALTTGDTGPRSARPRAARGHRVARSFLLTADASEARAR